jgi:hypothetical protein
MSYILETKRKLEEEYEKETENLYDECVLFLQDIQGFESSATRFEHDFKFIFNFNE